jgi:hypothetical protein
MTRRTTPISATERAVSWRKERLAEGYKQKAFLLSPEAQAALKLLAKTHGSERDAIEAVTIQAAKRKAR